MFVSADAFHNQSAADFIFELLYLQHLEHPGRRQQPLQNEN